MTPRDRRVEPRDRDMGAGVTGLEFAAVPVVCRLASLHERRGYQ